MMVKDVLESEEVKGYIWKYKQVSIVIKGWSYDMKDKYLNCQLESWMPGIGLDYGLSYPYITICVVNGLRHYWFLGSELRGDTNYDKTKKILQRTALRSI